MLRYLVIDQSDHKVIGVNQAHEIPNENNEVIFLEISWEQDINIFIFDYFFNDGKLIEVEKNK